MLSKSFEDITYDDIISMGNLLGAWEEFLRGKRKRKDVQEFQMHLMDNMLILHDELKTKTYIHGSYQAFNISDPKPRNIHKASVRDRLLHHAIYRQLYFSFDEKFIFHSYSCRRNKGTHRALNAFTKMARQVSNNHTGTCWALKCDIKKFFASIDHAILLTILEKKILDQDVLWLLRQTITSFETVSGKGLPLGNLTSQLLVNVYMDEFDQYIKHKLRTKYYIRYADDFVVFSPDRRHLAEVLQSIKVSLQNRLKLELHPDKVSISTVASGVDFLGWVHFPDHRTLRTATKRKMFRKIYDNEAAEHVIQSYLGLLSHGNTKKLEKALMNLNK